MDRLLIVSDNMSDENLYLVLLSSAISSELSFAIIFILLNSHWDDHTDILYTTQLVLKLRITSLPSTPVIIPVSVGAKFAEGKNTRSIVIEYSFLIMLLVKSSYWFLCNF